MNKVYGVGINDCKGWSNHEIRRPEDLEYRIYNLWHHIMMRCYSPKFKSQCPTYEGVTSCERWHTLSQFAEDIKKIPNYDLWRDNPRQCICLDKDTLIKGNKVYSPETCIFLTKIESSRDVCERHKEKMHTPEAMRKVVRNKLKPVICTHPDGTEVLYESAAQAEREGGFNHSYVAHICKGKAKFYRGCTFRYA